MALLDISLSNFTRKGEMMIEYTKEYLWLKRGSHTSCACDEQTCIRNTGEKLAVKIGALCRIMKQV